MNEAQALVELLSMLLLDWRSGPLLVMLAVAAAIDLRSYRIPNWLVMPGIAYALVLAAFAPTSQQGLLWSLSGFALGFGLMLPMYVFQVMGAGDVKLMAMVGAFLGSEATWSAVLFTFIAGGVLALAQAAARGQLVKLVGNVKAMFSQAFVSTLGGGLPGFGLAQDKSVGKLPYGVVICLGTALSMLARQLGAI